MYFFTGPMKQHIDGKKEMSLNSEVKSLQAGPLVYIPLINMGSTKVDLLVKEGDLVKVGTKLAVVNDNFIIPIYSSVSGTVKEVVKLMHASLKPIDHVVIENDSKYEQQAPLKPIDYKTATNDELVDFMMNIGIVGCGGAGFPTYIKYKNVTNIDTLIINAVECEPYLTSDCVMMHDNIHLLFAGISALLKMSGAKVAKVCIKVTKKEFISQLKQFASNYENMEIVCVPDVYPMGWERALVKHVSKLKYDKLPCEVGVIVNNVTTVIEFAKSMETGLPIIENLITISGEAIKTPCNVIVKVGMKVSEIVEACGGYTAEDVLLIAGGPLMGKTIPNDQFVVHTYLRAITVLPNIQIESLPCLRCGRCSDHCPSSLQPVRIVGAEKTKNIDSLIKLKANDCIECGLCSYVCPSKLDVTEGVRRAKRYMALTKK